MKKAKLEETQRQPRCSPCHRCSDIGPNLPLPSNSRRSNVSCFVNLSEAVHQRKVLTELEIYSQEAWSPHSTLGGHTVAWREPDKVTETGWRYHVPQSTFTLKCQRNILKRRNSGVYIGIVKIKIKTCLGYSALENKELPDLGTIKNWGLKKKKTSLTWGSTSFKMRYTELLGRSGLPTGMCRGLLRLHEKDSMGH